MSILWRHIVILLFISHISFGDAKTLEVCSVCDISSLKEAIIIAKDFDTILIKEGTYKENNIIINKPLTIIGEQYPVIDGDLKGEIITIESDNVTLDGLSLIHI